MQSKWNVALRSNWRACLASGVAVVCLLVSAAPVLAHGTAADGDASHLASDLLMAFGMPLAVLLIGALGGVLLSVVIGRRTEDEDPEPSGDDDPTAEARVADTQ